VAAPGTPVPPPPQGGDALTASTRDLLARAADLAARAVLLRGLLHGTAHHRLQAAAVAAPLAQDLRAFSRRAASTLPPHWGMDGWGLRLTPSARRFVWSDRDGTAPAAAFASFPASPSALCHWLGRLDGAARVSALSPAALPHKDFLVWEHSGGRRPFHRQRFLSASPCDAVAQACARGTTQAFRPAGTPTLSQAFLAGRDEALALPSRAATSASPHLLSRVAAHPSVQRVPKRHRMALHAMVKRGVPWIVGNGILLGPDVGGARDAAALWDARLGRLLEFLDRIPHHPLPVSTWWLPRADGGIEGRPVLADHPMMAAATWILSHISEPSWVWIDPDDLADRLTSVPLR